MFDYSYGIFEDSRCCEETTDPDCRKKHNHAVTAVDFGSEGGKDFWIVKNSWATDWAMDGYIKMSRNNNNNCGIATAASYPVSGEKSLNKVAYTGRPFGTIRDTS